jgi:hypothetical protein
MNFETSSQWAHQVNLQEDGFFWDSSSYKFSDVIQMWGIYQETNVNFAHHDYVDDYAFTLYLKNGKKLEQSIKRSATAGATLSFGLLSNTKDTAKELQNLYNILLTKTFDYRVQKFVDFHKNYGRWLLSTKENGSTISATEDGDVYIDNSFFANMWDGTCTATISRGGVDQNVIRFEKSSSLIKKFQDGNACHVDPTVDPDIVNQIIQNKLNLTFK